MDDHVLGTIVGHCRDARTRARLSCVSSRLRRLVAEDRAPGTCPELRRRLGIAAADAKGASRAASLLGGTFRAQLLADLAELSALGRWYDGRRQTSDLLSLPQGGRWLAQAQLLAAEGQHIVLYDAALRPLAALSFVDRPASTLPTARRPQPRAYFHTLATLLFKCGLSLGVAEFAPLLHGAADVLLARQHRQVDREQLATASAATRCQRWVDDDAHVLRLTAVRVQLLQRATLLRSLAGTLDDASVHHAAVHRLEGPCRLRFLDVSGRRGSQGGLSDAGLAQLLPLCAQLRVLLAAGSNAGPGVLAALAGRQPPQQQASMQGSGKHEHQRQLEGGNSACEGTAAQPACPLLEVLDVSSCRGIKGSGLRHAVRRLRQLQDLRLSCCSALHGLLGAGKEGGSSVSTPALAALTRLEALDADDVTVRHVEKLLLACTSLRHLAISGKLLATERFDRQQHGDVCQPSVGGSAACAPSLEQLEVGWGSGGSFLLHLLQRRAPYLHSLAIHTGACVSDAHLQLLGACRHLARLHLSCANITDAGVVAVLTRCTQLTALRLCACTGPFTDSIAAACAPRAPAYRLQELQIGWGASGVSDKGLAALTGTGFAALQRLSLKGLSRLTDAAWPLITRHGSSLSALELDSCGSLLSTRKSLGAGGPAPLSTAAALQSLAACSRLLALTLRDTTPPWPPADLQRLPMLQSVDVG